MKQRSPKNEIKICKIVQKEETVFEFFLEKNDNDKIVRERIFVSGEVLADQGILKPTIITAAQYQTLMQQKELQQAYDQALNYLAHRKRSVEEVRRFLLKKEVFSAVLIQTVLDKLLAKKYLNDNDFAISYIRTALKTTLAGPDRLKKDLHDFGLEDGLAQEHVMQLFSAKKQEEQLMRLFDKMAKKKYFSMKQMFDKYNQKAADLGYEYDVINRVKAQCPQDQVQIDEDKIKKLIEQDYDRLSKKAYSDFEIKQRLRHKLQTKGISYTETNRYLADFYEELGRMSEK